MYTLKVLARETVTWRKFDPLEEFSFQRCAMQIYTLVYTLTLVLDKIYTFKSYLKTYLFPISNSYWLTFVTIARLNLGTLVTPAKFRTLFIIVLLLILILLLLLLLLINVQNRSLYAS